MIYATMCVGNKWTNKYKTSINNFSKENTLHIFTDDMISFENCVCHEYTRDVFSYYEKISGEYFEGNFSSLSQFLGTDLDFNKIQNLVLGRAMDDLKQSVQTAYLEQKDPLVIYKMEAYNQFPT